MYRLTDAHGYDASAEVSVPLVQLLWTWTQQANSALEQNSRKYHFERSPPSWNSEYVQAPVYRLQRLPRFPPRTNTTSGADCFEAFFLKWAGGKITRSLGPFEKNSLAPWDQYFFEKFLSFEFEIETLTVHVDWATFLLHFWEIGKNRNLNGAYWFDYLRVFVLIFTIIETSVVHTDFAAYFFQTWIALERKAQAGKAAQASQDKAKENRTRQRKQLQAIELATV